MPAHTAEDRFFMQMADRPANDRMILRFLMTKIAWIVLSATGKLNRYDIQLRMVMDTTGHTIHDFAFDNHFFHTLHFLTEKGARCQRLFSLIINGRHLSRVFASNVDDILPHAKKCRLVQSVSQSDLSICRIDPIVFSTLPQPAFVHLYGKK